MAVPPPNLTIICWQSLQERRSPAFSRVRAASASSTARWPGEDRKDRGRWRQASRMAVARSRWPGQASTSPAGTVRRCVERLLAELSEGSPRARLFRPGPSQCGGVCTGRQGEHAGTPRLSPRGGAVLLPGPSSPPLPTPEAGPTTWPNPGPTAGSGVLPSHSEPASGHCYSCDSSENSADEDTHRGSARVSVGRDPPPLPSPPLLRRGPHQARSRGSGRLSPCLVFWAVRRRRLCSSSWWVRVGLAPAIRRTVASCRNTWGWCRGDAPVCAPVDGCLSMRHLMCHPTRALLSALPCPAFPLEATSVLTRSSEGARHLEEQPEWGAQCRSAGLSSAGDKEPRHACRGWNASGPARGAASGLGGLPPA